MVARFFFWVVRSGALVADQIESFCSDGHLLKKGEGHMIRYFTIGLPMAMALALAGCGQKGETYISYEKGQQVNTIPAPKTAEYALYAGENAAPKVVVKLTKGEKLGFENTRDGKVQAIAGAGYSTVLD